MEFINKCSCGNVEKLEVSPYTYDLLTRSGGTLCQECYDKCVKAADSYEEGVE